MPQLSLRAHGGLNITSLFFRDEIIPFIKELKDIFNNFNQYLVDELVDVQNVFYQMEQAVEQHRLESRTFEVKMNQVLSENERLLAQAIDHDIVKTVVNLSVNDGTRFGPSSPKNKLRKLKGKALDKEAIETHSVDPKVSKDNVEPITPKLPMRVASVNGKKYILVIVDDYSRFTWVKCLRSKDEAPAFIINFLKMIQVRLKETVRRIRTDNGTEFVNQTLREYYEKVGIC
ncbi:retrovirus-related pol polyprotein from transposon TNT 1-94 [Tanacetum coccineum]